jgi:hypothetical protein
MSVPRFEPGSFMTERNNCSGCQNLKWAYTVLNIWKVQLCPISVQSLLLMYFRLYKSQDKCTHFDSIIYLVKICLRTLLRHLPSRCLSVTWSGSTYTKFLSWPNVSEASLAIGIYHFSCSNKYPFSKNISFTIWKQELKAFQNVFFITVSLKWPHWGILPF